MAAAAVTPKTCNVHFTVTLSGGVAFSGLHPQPAMTPPTTSEESKGVSVVMCECVCVYIYIIYIYMYYIYVYMYIYINIYIYVYIYIFKDIYIYF